MSRNIKPTQEFIDSCRNDFLNMLSKGVFASGKVDFSRSFAIDTKQKASLTFTEKAWHKMWALVDEFSSEVAWHGVCKREELEEGATEIAAYRIEDILVYPQTVSGATASSDDEKYPMWLMSHPDEVFNHIRFQGHSHVNMGVTPSTVDTTFYNELLGQLKDGDFYVFAIYNKKRDKTIKIYDYGMNLMFETADVNVYIEKEPDGLERFIDEAKSMVTEVKYTTAPTRTYYGAYVNTPSTPAKTASAPATSKPITKPSSYANALYDDDDDIYYGALSNFYNTKGI